MSAPVGSPGFRLALRFYGGPLRRAGHAWGGLAELVRQRAEAMLAPIHAAERAWDGRAARTALPRLRQLRHRLEVAALPLRGHEEALCGLAHAGDRLRDRAQHLIARAAAGGVAIDQDGRVRRAGVPDEFAARAVDAYRREVAEIAAEAAALDRRAVRELAHHAPWPAEQALGAVRVDSVPGAGTEPAQVHRWWTGLAAAQQRYLVALRPELVGALAGVPVAARDAANRRLLEREEHRLRDLVDGLSRDRDLTGALPYPPPPLMPHTAPALRGERLRRAETALAGLAAVQRWLSRPAGHDRRPYLLDVSTRGDGRLVLALGNPDRADNVLTYVPGAGSSLSGAGGQLDRARTMAADAAGLDGPDRTAVVYWLGYDAPDWRLAGNNPASGHAAAAAADDLRTFADGLRATHAGDGPQHTVLGHSYGSTVVGQAAAGGLAADRLILLGSPGASVDHADELAIDADPHRHVWAGRSADDPVRFVPDLVHGPDPTGADFGARVFDAGTDAGHSGYWDAGEPARDNVALIAVGRYDDVQR